MYYKAVRYYHRYIIQTGLITRKINLTYFQNYQNPIKNALDKSCSIKVPVARVNFYFSYTDLNQKLINTRYLYLSLSNRSIKIRSTDSTLGISTGGWRDN